MTISMRLWRTVRAVATRAGWMALGFVANAILALYASKGPKRPTAGVNAPSSVVGDE